MGFLSGGRTFSRRLQTQLLAVFIITITILMGTVSILSYSRSKRVIQEQSASIMQQYFEQNSRGIERFTEEVEKTLWLLMIQDGLEEYMRRGWANNRNVLKAREIFDYSNTVLSNYDYLDSIYFYGSDGNALGINRSKNMVTLEPNPDLPWYGLPILQDALENRGKVLWYGGYTNQDFVMEAEEEVVPYLTVVGNLWMGSGRYVSVVMNIRQSEVAKLIAADETGEMEFYLMNSDGTIVVHQEKEKVGTSSGFTLEELEKGQEGYLMRDDIQINYYKIPHLPWIIVSEITKESLYGNLVHLRRWFVVLAVGGILTAIVLLYYSLYRLTAPLKQLRKVMGRMENGFLGIQLDENSKNELGILGREFNRMSRSINDMVIRIQDIEEEKRILEKEALQGQLNPHFLFNTLSNMRFMAKLGKTGELEECFGALGRMLLPMYRSEGELWSLKQELDYMSNYTIIMNSRFGGNLHVEFEIPELLEDYQVLKFILQPLVENAIEHGFAGSKGKGIIVMGAEEKNGLLELYVEDNGSGISEEDLLGLREMLKQAENQKELYRNHVGIVNVHRRLKVYFGDAYGIRVESIPGESTCIYLTMPVLCES